MSKKQRAPAPSKRQPKQRRDLSKPITWMGSSLADLTTFPETVKRTMGFCLRQLQEGQGDERIKTMAGNKKLAGGLIREIIEDHDTVTYRVVVAVKYIEALYVLHAFKKKSKSGIATPRKDIDLIVKRFNDVKKFRKERGWKE